MADPVTTDAATTPLYPSTLPLGAIKQLIRIVESGAITTEKALFAKSLWLLIGYCECAVLGDPDNIAMMAAVPVVESDPTAVLKFVVHQQDVKSGAVTPQVAFTGLATIPFELLLQWALPYLIKLLESELGIKVA